MEVHSTSDPTGVELVQRLFLKHAGVLQGFVAGLVPDLNSAEDVLQEVFLIVIRQADKFRPGSEFLPWVRGIAYLKCLEHYRSRKTGPRPLDGRTLEAVITANRETGDSWTMRREALFSCLEKLPPKARDIIQLRYSEDLLSVREIAGRLSWNTHAVEVALTRARKWLRECTQRRLVGERA